MPSSAGSQLCPPFISDETMHRREIARWMALVQPSINLAASLSADVTSAVAASQPWVIVTQPPYNAATDGVTDIKPALSAAASDLGSGGGVLVLPATGAYLIDQSWTMPRSIQLRGTRPHNGIPGVNTNAPNFNEVEGRVYIASAATVTMLGNSGIDGLFVMRKGLVPPVADSSAFTGTAFYVAEDDCFIRNSMILGFNEAIHCSAAQRLVVVDNTFDNRNNVYIERCFDICKVARNHAWPFTTLAGGGGTAGAHRNGTSYALYNVNDWAKLTDNFCYGYYRGFQLVNVGDVVLLGCGADNTQAFSGSIGIQVKGACPSTHLVACQAAAQEHGLHISNSTTYTTLVSSFASWGNSVDGIRIDKGVVQVTGSWIADGDNGISVNCGSSGGLLCTNTFFYHQAVRPIQVNASSSDITIVACRFDPPNAIPVSSNLTMPKVSVSSTVSASMNFDICKILGSGTIDAVTGGWMGRRMTFYINAATVVFKNNSVGQHGFQLGSGADFSATANATLTVLHNGTQWIETGRKV